MTSVKLTSDEQPGTRRSLVTGHLSLRSNVNRRSQAVVHPVGQVRRGDDHHQLYNLFSVEEFSDLVEV